MESAPINGRDGSDMTEYEARALFLEQVTLRTLSGLSLTSLASLVVAIGMLVAQSTGLSVAATFAGLLGPPIVGRRMVVHAPKWLGLLVAGVLLGSAQSYLIIAHVFSGLGVGAVLIVVVIVLFALMSVNDEVGLPPVVGSRFGGIVAALPHAELPMRVIMGLQFVAFVQAPSSGLLRQFLMGLRGEGGTVLSGGLLALSLLLFGFRREQVLRRMPTGAATEAAFELTDATAVLVWNLLMFLYRM